MARLERNWTSDRPVIQRRATFLASTPSHLTVDRRRRRDKVEHMWLLPGGKWLVTLSDLLVSLWDLDLGDDFMSASHSFDGAEKVRLAAIDTTRGPGAFRVAYLLEPVGYASIVVAIKELALTHLLYRARAELCILGGSAQPIPQFIHLKKILLHRRTIDVAIRDDALAFVWSGPGDTPAATVTIIDWRKAEQGVFTGSSVTGGEAILGINLWVCTSYTSKRFASVVTYTCREISQSSCQTTASC
jgi:hypothetical protein